MLADSNRDRYSGEPEKSFQSNSSRYGSDVRLCAYTGDTRCCLEAMHGVLIVTNQNNVQRLSTWLAREYVQQLSHATARSWCIPIHGQPQERYLIAIAWQRLCFAVYPGTKCGTQPRESLHASWQRTCKRTGLTGYFSARPYRDAERVPGEHYLAPVCGRGRRVVFGCTVHG